MYNMKFEHRIRSFDTLSVKEKLNLLRELQSQQDFHPYLSLCEHALFDPSAKVRQLAFSILVRKNLITPETTLSLLKDTSKVLRRKALRQMVTWTHPDYLPYIEPFLRDPDIYLRLLAIEWISKLGDSALPILEPLLRDPMYSVREKVKHYIQEIKKRLPTPNHIASPPHTDDTHEPRAAKPLWKTLYEKLNPDNPKLFRKIVNRLLDEYPEDSISLILSYLEHPSWEIRDIIVEAFCERETVPLNPFIRLLQHPIWYVRACAIEILGHSGHPALLQHADHLSQDPNVEVRRALASVLYQYRKKETTYAILDKLTKDEHFVVRREAKKSLSLLRQG